ncbi:TIGR01777 family oxidoreductase [bacterium]|jgi:uncharacterized protein|nr:TIGR01777 family oxidoreductase [bacterium]MDB4802349.1 TIGR01777 family oxidoreductase [bacterium]
MKIVIAGGTGQLGIILKRHWETTGNNVWILSRSKHCPEEKIIEWDGKTLGGWIEVVNGADVVVNLAGKSVNCRYSEQNLNEMMASRVDSTNAIGEAIQSVKNPPQTWLQMSTATIYSHRYNEANDELSGEIGGSEPNAPDYWKRSIEIAQAWEATLKKFDTPNTRKVALRSAMVMSPDVRGVFNVLSKMTRMGLGGPIAGGRQYISWIHEFDFVRALDFLIDNTDLTGPVNLTSPNPIPQRQFMKELRTAWNIPFGLPATKLMAEIGAFILRTDTELLLKSRRVIPTRLERAGFRFKYPHWGLAAKELVSRKI